MDAVGALSFLLIATAALAALGGYVAGVVRQRRRRSTRYFVLGVVTGFLAAVVTRRVPGPRRFVLAQWLDNPLTVAALHLRRGLSRTGISR
ncbi:hypothetical protein [Mycobacterium sp. shizuoka-1]|uniref:hypothetical protein n=1 Tax=Mycobacterium sp. shizuoka-1 TaxID=2039281 RepID=UPI000C0807DC|nr:hypothetical protein [Mycobacterium sp. shizuoka-1]